METDDMVIQDNFPSVRPLNSFSCAGGNSAGAARPAAGCGAPPTTNTFEASPPLGRSRFAGTLVQRYRSPVTISLSSPEQNSLMQFSFIARYYARTDETKTSLYITAKHDNMLHAGC